MVKFQPHFTKVTVQAFEISVQITIGISRRNIIYKKANHNSLACSFQKTCITKCWSVKPMRLGFSTSFPAEISRLTAALEGSPYYCA